jgi:hypothetical protein
MHMRHTIKVLGLVFALALSACGPAGEAKQHDRFIGTWRSTSGTTTTACNGYTSTESFATTMTWSAGVSSDLVISTPGSSCVVMADVGGSTATGLAGQTCTGSDGAGGVVTVSLTSYTFVISPDGRTATENESGTFAFIDQGATVVCSFNSTGSYQKISD